MSEKIRQLSELPDPFLFTSGSRVSGRKEWQVRRREIQDMVVDMEYGGLPPRPESLTVRRLDTHREKRFFDSEYTQYRIVNGDDPAFHFRLDVLVPASEEPLPVVLTGDGCWMYLTDEIRRDILSRGLALAVFSRTSIVPDISGCERDTGLYVVYPDHSFGAIAAWAWGYHRAIDVMEEVEGIDASRIAVTGHSRGGKTALLAGATDERIAVTAPNCAGVGGTGSFMYQGPECEKIADLVSRFPHWFGPELEEYTDREADLPFDQHYLEALIAPRGFLNVNALGDLWSNPRGAWQLQKAAREVYRFLDAEERIGHVFRSGGHDHSREDWVAFLDFVQWELQDVEPERDFHHDPFPEQPNAFSWAAPQKKGVCD